MLTLPRLTASFTLNGSFLKASSIFVQSVSKHTPIFRHLSAESSHGGSDEGVDPWESAWLSEEALFGNIRGPSEGGFDLPHDSSDTLPPDVDAGSDVFGEDASDYQGKRAAATSPKTEPHKAEGAGRDLERRQRDYRLQKQRIHASLWMKEIEKQEEAKLADPIDGDGDDIDRLLDSCSDVFDPLSNAFDDSIPPSSSEFSNKPDGWETSSTDPGGNSQELSQREESILFEEFERRKSFCKYQIVNFVKSHIISQKRPVDGWQYIIKEIGPNSGMKKDSVSKPPATPTPPVQPFRERDRS